MSDKRVEPWQRWKPRLCMRAVYLVEPGIQMQADRSMKPVSDMRAENRMSPRCVRAGL